MFIRSAARKGRAIFLHQKASRASLFVRIYPTHSPVRHRHRYPGFFTLLISRIQFYTRPIWREDAAGEGKRVWGGRFRAGTEIELETILHSLRRIRSTPVNLCMYREKRISYIYASNETDPFAHFYFRCIIAIIIASASLVLRAKFSLILSHGSIIASPFRRSINVAGMFYDQEVLFWDSK